MAAPIGYLLAVTSCFVYFSNSAGTFLPLVVNTWPFTNATAKGWEVISQPGSTAVDAVVAGCAECEQQRCDGTVGWGGDPDEQGETTLDAMIMDGKTHDVGSVGALRRVKSAIAVARAVMDYTGHTLLVGDQATDFAMMMGFKVEDLHSNTSVSQWKEWKMKNCQPNYRQNVTPDPKKSCGPYKPISRQDKNVYFMNTDLDRKRFGIGPTNHDTIGMIVVDADGNVAGGTSTNGLGHKVPGRVGDSPIVGAGSYAENGVGGAAATGDGDIMMRFLPSFQAVNLMRSGLSPAEATQQAIKPIIQFYPQFSGAVLAASVHGVYGAACHGFPVFHYSVRNPSFPNITLASVNCI